MTILVAAQKVELAIEVGSGTVYDRFKDEFEALVEKEKATFAAYLNNKLNALHQAKRDIIVEEEAKAQAEADAAKLKAGV